MSAWAGHPGRGSVQEDSQRQKTVVAVLCLVAVALIVAAWLADSYLPLFFVWVPQLSIPVYLSRSSRRKASAAGRRTGGTTPPGSTALGGAHDREDVARRDKPR